MSSPTPDWRIEPLGTQHDREGFSCRVRALENYLRRHASQDVKKKATAVFVVTSDAKAIAGYYTLSQYSLKLADIPEAQAKQLPKYPRVPATLLGRLAVGDEHRGQNLGEKLLMDALYRSFCHSAQIGSFAVVVDAKDDEAKGFYQKYGFIALPGTSNRLFLPMKTIEQILD